MLHQGLFAYPSQLRVLGACGLPDVSSACGDVYAPRTPLPRGPSLFFGSDIVYVHISRDPLMNGQRLCILLHVRQASVRAYTHYARINLRMHPQARACTYKRS